MQKYHRSFLGGDQGVINLAVHKYKVPTTNIGPKYNYLTFLKEKYPLNEVNPAIIHYAQNPKPWIQGAEEIYGTGLFEIWKKKNVEVKSFIKDFQSKKTEWRFPQFSKRCF